METEIITIVIKGIGMVLAIFGGIAIGYYGFHLYKDGVGKGRDLVVFELGTVKLEAHSVGSVIMATAFLWAWAGVALSPNLEKGNGRTRIYSFHTGGYKVEAEPLVTNANVSNIKQDPQKVQGLFRDSIYKWFSKKGSFLKLNDQPARYNLNSVRIKQIDSGNYLLTAKVESGTSCVNLEFEPKMMYNQLTFVPKGVEQPLAGGSDPNQEVR